MFWGLSVKSRAQSLARGWSGRTLRRSAASAPTRSFSRSRIRRRSPSSCWTRHWSGRVLPALKAALARCTTSLTVLMVPEDRELLGAGRSPQGSTHPLAGVPRAAPTRTDNFIGRGRSPWEHREMASFCLLSSLTLLSWTLLALSVLPP